MFKNSLVLAFVLIVGSFGLQAQEKLIPADRTSHHVGLQVNALLKQVVNFGNSPAINNPFLIKYSLRFNESKKELMFGLGYAYAQESMKGGLKSDNSDLNFRIGYGKKYALGKKVELGLGLDLVLNAQNIQTVNVQAFNFGTGFDSTITTTKSINIGYGLGPQATLAYYITDRIMIGTEATFYFIRSQDNLETRTENHSKSGGSPVIVTADIQSEENSRMDFNLQVPVALFLIIVL